MRELAAVDGEARISQGWFRWASYLSAQIKELYQQVAAGGGGGGGGVDAVATIFSATGSITLDHADATVFIVRMIGNIALNEPTGLVDDKRLSVLLVQDATGGRQATFDSWWGLFRDAVPTPNSVSIINGIVDTGDFVFLGQDERV